MEHSNNKNLDRKELVYFPTIINMADNSTIGRVVDITTEGFLVISDIEMKPDDNLDIKIQWTDELGNEAYIQCKAEVRWCKEDVNPDYMAIGLRITQIDEKDRENIKRLMRKWGFPSWQ